MAYQVAKDNAVSIRHPVRDVAGTLVSGEAANITTALADGDNASSVITVTVTEIGTSGWYLLAFTPTTTGLWVLTVTNPSGTNTLVSEYIVDVVSGATLAAITAKNLTTLARVRSRIFSGETSPTTDHDALISELIIEVSNNITDELGRCPLEAAYTEYVDGTGGALLQLQQGPLVSVTSVSSISYSGTTTRTETATTVNVADYLERGLRSDNSFGPALLERRDGTWERGRKNYKVVYTAGYAAVPDGLLLAATNEVVAEFFARETHGRNSKVAGDIQTDYLTPAQRAASRSRAIRPYKYYGVA